MRNTHTSDVIIIGGSYAGLSAAMALGRSLRNVLIIDSGLPCNRQTPHSHNFITHDGKTPAEIAAIARTQVLSYPTVQLLNDIATDVKKRDNMFVVSTKTEKQYTSRKIVLATGIQDIMPDIKGFSECWGISVVHCPYCHGYELRGKRTGIMANGDKAVHLASLVNNLTDDITLLTGGTAALNTEQRTKLNNHNIRILEKEILEIEHHQGQVSKVVFKDGSSAPFEAVYAAVPFRQVANIVDALGCELTEQGYIKVDNFQKTTIAGVFACGDNSNLTRALSPAVAAGTLAGAMVNRELTEESF